jgi:hypothetical protein
MRISRPHPEEDDAVHLRCRSGRHPFFDESKLADRATSNHRHPAVDSRKPAGESGSCWLSWAGQFWLPQC